MPEDNIEFEIMFFEGVLRRRPGFAECLIALGDAYSRKGMYEKGLEVDLKLLDLRPDDEVVYYNLACDYSLLRKPELCLENLKKALALGYDDFEHMAKDEDLAFIRADERYLELKSKYRRKDHKR